MVPFGLLVFDLFVAGVGGTIKNAGCLCTHMGQPVYYKVAEQRAQADRRLSLHP